MTPLPKPMHSSRPGLPQPRRKSGIRTAAGTVQDQLIGRCQQLAGDPTLALPEAVGDEPRPLRAVRARLERMREKPATLFDRWDKGIVGAVAGAIPIAQWESAPRVADAKVAGNRRFYLIRGHASRACQLGVQNHDDPHALLLAYTDFARKHRLHFFAGPRLWCTGAAPAPPEAWVARLGERCGIAFAPDGAGAGTGAGAGWSCRHADRDRVVLAFRTPDGSPGPFLAACGECGRKAEGLHRRLRSHYAGPQQKLPVEVAVRKADGTRLEPAREPLAFYRAGRLDEDGLLKAPGATAFPG